ncbi:MAG: hypothetical protein DDG60_07750 [Anaerolineae bacterium]|nr:MAG: hypothetical protein DDG60_07750 [Anaerolineae bacterium]
MNPEIASLSQANEAQHALKTAWEQFTRTQQIADNVPPIIAASWRRCWGKINPYQRVEFTRVDTSYLLAAQTASFDLMAVARPVLEDIYQCIQESGTTLILTNPVGCILDMISDSEIHPIVQAWGTQPGCILSEEFIGTTSFGLALTERMPVQVAGYEHFIAQFHQVTGAAAPIFDMSGHLLGVLGLVMPVEKYHVHSLGLVTAAARAIESQRQSEILLAEQNSQLAQLNAILSAISDGILVLNEEGILVHANQAASHILNISTQSVLGHSIDQILVLPEFVRRYIAKRKPLTDVEGIVSVGNHSVRCVISLDYVFQTPKHLRWIILTLRAENKVRLLVQKQVGANAPLTLNDIPGETPPMQRVRNFVRSAAGAQASILIRGEVGTGKNALASAIHNAGPRRNGPFVVFACASIPNELVISELLGLDESENKQGSGRPSKFELAKGGTLFFQDVDALPLEAQTVLLNALELGVIQRLRGHRAIEIDVRIIASTSANIEKLISQGAFRPELYYRLSIFSITLPPLRERPQDMPLVVERILTRFSNQLGYSIELAPAVMETLTKYPWPGNIRELESVLGRAIMQVAESGGTIDLSHLPPHISTPQPIPIQPSQVTDFNSLEEVEYETILRAAQIYQGNITHMAKMLGVGRTTLWRKMKYFKINAQDFRIHRTS